MTTAASTTLNYKGAGLFRQRVAFSLLSGKVVKITDIRTMDEEPGIRDYEAGFLRLVDKVTNGCIIETNETGTEIRFQPGVIMGGRNVKFDCGTSRSVGYYIEGLLLIAPFGKKDMQVQLTGITNDSRDLSVDTLRTVTLPLFRHFDIADGLELKIERRGAPPNGGGQVLLRCPSTRKLTPVQLIDQGKVKRIRGVAYCTRMSPLTANRMVDKARGVLNNFIPDVYIYTDHYRGVESGKSPGFGISLVAQTTTGCLKSAEVVGGAGVVPEDVGVQASQVLCEEISSGGCVDSSNAWLFLSLMALTPEDVSRVRLGKLSSFTVQTLRQIKDFFGVQFNLKEEPKTTTIIASCVGTGFTNVAKKAA